MISALNFEPPAGLVPHFELEFFLTMEAFGKIHPSQRIYSQWDQMTESEKNLHRVDIAELYISTVNEFDLSGIIFIVPHGWHRHDIRLSLEHVRKVDGMNHILCLHGDATFGLPEGGSMMEFVSDLIEQPDKMKEKAQLEVDEKLKWAEEVKEWGLLDAVALCSDYCFNDNPFLSPEMFDEFVTPYLIQLVTGYRELGFYVIKHTDGNIMPILDSLAAAKPHALHSLDPQGGVDIAEVKRLIGDEICLIGNVNCAALQTGSDEDVEASVKYALKHGMPGGGYIFGTSNCIYTGMNLERYKFMLDIWKREGVYE